MCAQRAVLNALPGGYKEDERGVPHTVSWYQGNYLYIATYIPLVVLGGSDT